MASMLRIKARWTGFTGAPGYSNFYFREFGGDWTTPEAAAAAAERVRVFFDATKGLYPTGTKIAVQSDAEIIEEVDGKITAVLNAGTIAQVSGTAVAGGYSAASGAVVTWRTNGVVAGRRVRGRTFLVPISGNNYANDGTLAPTVVTTIQNAGTALATGTGTPDLGVWARPAKERVNKAGETIPARDGSWYLATSVTVPTKVSILRSRRD